MNTNEFLHKLLAFLLVVLLGTLVTIVVIEATNDTTLTESTSAYFENKDGSRWDLDIIAVADTDAAQAQGLSGHPGLAENEAMLFLYPTPERYSFWMKDMLFDIDMIWVNDSEVVHIEHSVSKDSYPTTYTPNSPADKVVEVAAGQSAANNVGIGTLFVAQ